MGYAKDQIIQELEEEREYLEQVLDDIEAYGEEHTCPDGYCQSEVCSKSCFAHQCFDWCLVHKHPSVEDRDGEVSVTVTYSAKNTQGQVVSQTKVEQRRVCGHQDARDYPGDCRIIKGGILTSEELWEFEEEQRMLEVMTRDSP